MAPPPPLPINRSSRLRGAAVRPWRAVRRRSASLTGLPAMTITYSCVANGRAVLAELALTGGAYQVPAGRASASEGSAPRGRRPPGLPSGRGATWKDSGREAPPPPEALPPRRDCACATHGLRLVLPAGV